ncbi:MAG: hypothetical protein AAB425_04030, partial [Bdellovibrionota bacterium]
MANTRSEWSQTDLNRLLYVAVLACVCIYGYTSIDSDFVYLDDHILPRFFSFHSDPKNLLEIFSSWSGTRHFHRTESYFRPVMAASQIIDSTLSRWLFDSAVAGVYRMSNLVLHLANHISFRP